MRFKLKRRLKDLDILPCDALDYWNALETKESHIATLFLCFAALWLFFYFLSKGNDTYGFCSIGNFLIGYLIAWAGLQKQANHDDESYSEKINRFVSFISRVITDLLSRVLLLFSMQSSFLAVGIAIGGMTKVIYVLIPAIPSSSFKPVILAELLISTFVVGPIYWWFILHKRRSGTDETDIQKYETEIDRIKIIQKRNYLTDAESLKGGR